MNKNIGVIHIKVNQIGVTKIEVTKTGVLRAKFSKKWGQTKKTLFVMKRVHNILQESLRHLVN